MITYAEALATHDIEIPAHLIADAEVPVLTSLQIQGDLIFIPTRPSAKVGDAVPVEGIQIVRGEASANTHWLNAADGPVYWASTATRDGQDLGIIDVPKGSIAVITHTDEHGANALGTGTWIVRRQREQADVIRIVAD